MTRHEVGDLSWEVTDKYGWPVEKAAIRDARIDSLLGEAAQEFIYSICLSGKEDRTMHRAVLNFREGKMAHRARHPAEPDRAGGAQGSVL